MKDKLNIYYFCNHPYVLALYNNINNILADSNSNINHILILSKHMYFDNLEYQHFTQSFNEVIQISNVDFKKNILKYLPAWLNFKKELKKIRIKEKSIVFTISYSDLATNLFCKHVKIDSPLSLLVHFTVYGNFLKIDKFKLSFTNTAANILNVLLLRGYAAKSYTDEYGNVVERIYFTDPHDKIYTLSDSNEIESLYPKLPFPKIISNNMTDGSNRMVLFLGDSTLLDYFPKIDKEEYYYKINNYFKAIAENYSEDVDIFYKPHPMDKGRIDKNFELGRIKCFCEKLTAEFIYNKYSSRIIAVYSVLSTSCITASNYGIPAYVLYQNCGIPEDVADRLKGHFLTANRDYFYEVEEISEIGKIDFSKNIQVDDMVVYWTNFIHDLKKVLDGRRK